MASSAAAAVAQATPRPLTAADVAAVDRISDPQISLDGRSLAYKLRVADLAGNSARQELWVANTSGPQVFRRIAGAKASATSPRWSPDGRHLYFISVAQGLEQVWRIGLDGEGLRQVTRLPVAIGSFRLSPDGHRIVVSAAVFPGCPTLECSAEKLARTASNNPSGQRFVREPIRNWDQWMNGSRNRLYLLELDDDGVAQGAAREIAPAFDGDVPSQPGGDDTEYVFTRDGAAIIFSSYAPGGGDPWGVNYDLYRVDLAGDGRPVNLTSGNRALDLGPLVSPDGRLLAYRATRRQGLESDRQAIMVRDLRSGRVREIAPAWDRTPETIAWSDDGRTIYAIARDVGQSRIFAVDVASGRVKAVTGQGWVSAMSASAGQVVYAAETMRSPSQLYRASDDGSVAITAHNSERLRDIRFGDYEQFDFPGWNGETVHAYLVKPAKVEPGAKYPVVFIVHGGPQGTLGNFFDFRWNPQVFAGHGYAVLMVDFHGSKGYGQAFTDSVSLHWGDRPLEDLQKGWAEALVRYPFLDAGRACAIGASYGGFMVNWMSSQWKEPWKCMVNHAGIFDYRMMSYSIDLISFMEWENGGTPYEQPANSTRFNPIDHVGEWSTPMLITHGGRDYRVPAEQGIATFAALQRKGVPSEFLYFPDENHRIGRPANFVQWHEATEAWLDRWTQPVAR